MGTTPIVMDIMRMKCKCGGTFKEEYHTIFGEKTKIKVCRKCGEELINIDEAIRVQKEIMPRIHKERKK